MEQHIQKAGNFVIVPVDLLRSPLSMEAKITYAMMGSFGPINRASLAAQSKRIGRSEKAIRKYQKELIDAGWLVLTREAKASMPRHWFLPEVKGGRPPLIEWTAQSDDRVADLAGLGKRSIPREIGVADLTTPPTESPGKSDHSPNRPPKTHKSTHKSISKPHKGCTYSGAFETWWAEYPKRRRVKKIKAWEAWQKHVNEDNLISMLETLEWQKTSQDWKEDGGKWIPQAPSYLNAGKWDDAKPDDPAAPGGSPRRRVVV